MNNYLALEAAGSGVSSVAVLLEGIAMAAT